MSYTPKTWHTGDTVTATDLNNIENGIANSGNTAVAIIDYTNTTAERTMGYQVALCQEETHSGQTKLAVKSYIMYGTFGTYNRGVTITPVLPLAHVITDDYDVCILFNSNDIYGFNVNVVGNISASELLASEYENGTWSSVTYMAFVVQGSGKIILSNS